MRPFNWFRTWIRKLLNLRFVLPELRRHDKTYRRKVLFAPCLQLLEDRTMPSVYQWTGASSVNWNDPGNWSLISGLGTFPNAVGDVARFTGTYAATQTTASVNTAITVGEIDFGTSANVTINASGANVLTLQNTSGAAIFDVGQAFTNSGVDSITAPIAFTSNGAATIQGTQPLTIGAMTLNGSDTLTINSTAAATLTGNVGNTAPTDTLTFAGSGMLNLPNANTDSNTTILNGATLNVGNNTALGTGGLTLTSGSIQASVAGVALGNALTFSAGGGVTLGGTNAFSFSATGATAITLNGTNTLTFTDSAGVTLSGAAPTVATTLSTDKLVLAGNQTLTISNAITDNAQSTILSGATVVLGNAGSLGGAASALTINSGTLQTSVAAGITVANNFTFGNGGGLTIGGANAITFSGLGFLAGTDTITVTNAANVATFAGTIDDAGNGWNLTTTGSGTVSLTAAETFTGGVAVSGGTLKVTGTGALTSVSTYTVNPGGTLLIDDTTQSGRLNSNANLNLDGGTFTLNGTSTANNSISESINVIAVQSGFSTVNMNLSAGSTTLTLNASSLSRSPASSGLPLATVNFVAGGGGALGSGNDDILFSTAPTLTNNILPYATVGGSIFASYGLDGQTGLSALQSTDSLYFTSLAAAAGNPNANVVESASDFAPVGGQTVNSLIITGINLTLGGGPLTVGAGISGNPGAVLVTGGSDTITASLAVGQEGILNTNAAATAVYDGVISGSALTLAGGGTVQLNAADTYSAGTTLDSGTLSIGNPTGLGTGKVYLITGTVQAGIATTVTNPVILNNGQGNVAVTFGGNTPLTFSGTTTLSGVTPITVTNTGGTIFSGQVTGGGGLTVTAASTGTLVLSNNSNNYGGPTAGTTLLGGTLVVGSSGALSTNSLTPLTLTGGTLAASAAVTLSNPLTINGSVAFGGNNPITLSGGTTLTSPAGVGTLTLTVNNNTTLSGVISGNTGNPLGIAGFGTLTLSNASNTYPGGTILNASTANAPLGTLIVGSASVLGTGPLTLTSGNLQASGNFTLANPLALNGAAGSLLVFNGSNPLTFNGLATLTNAATIRATQPTTLNGIVSGAGSLTLESGSLTLTENNTYTGATTVSGGTLTVSGTNGALSGPSNLVLNQGGTLTLDNTTSNNANRVAATATLTLNGGTFNYLGNGSAASTQTLAGVTLGAGASTIGSTPGSGKTVTLTFASLTRAAGSGGALNFSGANLGSSNQIIFTATPTLTGTAQPGGTGLLPYATVNGTDFATYNGSSGIVAYTGVGAAYAPTVSGAAAAANVNLAGNDTVTASKSINALLVSGNATLTINAGVTLTVSSGGLLVTPGTTLTINGGGTLALGSEAIITTGSGSNVSVASDGTTLTGTNLTLAGSGTVNLPGANSFGAGTTTLAGATLNLGAAAAIGTGSLTLVRGTLTTTSTSGLLLPNNVILSNSTVTLGGTNPLIFGTNANSSTLTLNGTNDTVNVTNTAPIYFNNIVGGSAILTKTGAGTLVLVGNNNTNSGVTFVNAGIIQINASTGLGPATAATVVASGASVQVLGAGLGGVVRPLVLNGTGTDGTGALRFLAGSTNSTYSGNILLNTATSIGVDPSLTLTVTGIVSGAGDLTKVGQGTVVLNAINTYTGNTIVSTGVLNVQNGSGLGLTSSVGGTVTVVSGATLQVQGGITVVGKSVTLNGTGFGNSGALGQGALVNQANTNTWTGSITLTGTVGLTTGTIPLLSAANTGTLIGAANGTTLNVTGVVSGTDLTKVGAGAVTLVNINTYSGATTVLGGTLTLSNTNATTGATTVSGMAVNGTFTAGGLTLNLFGTLATSAIALAPGGTLTLDNTVVNIVGTSTVGSGRLNNGSAKPNLTLNGGGLGGTAVSTGITFLANNATNVPAAESLGTVTLQSGLSIINAGYTAAQMAGATSVLNFAGLSRSTGATLSINANTTTTNYLPLDQSTNQILFKTTASLTAALYSGTNGTTASQILPYAQVGAGAPVAGNTALTTGDFAMAYVSGASTGFMALPLANYYVANTVALLNAAGPNYLVRLNAATTFTQNVTVGALLLDAGTTAGFTTTITGFTLNIASGAFMSNGNNATRVIVTGGTINLSTETILFQNYGNSAGNQWTEIDATIIGSGSLVISGNNRLYLNSAAGANTFTGGLVINSTQQVLFNTNNQAGAGTITINGGAIASNTAGITIANPLTITGAVSLGGNGNNNAFLMTGPVTLSGNAFIDTTSTVTASGTVSGTGAITTTSGGGSLTLISTNTYSGGTILAGGTLSLGSPASLGSGTVTFAGGALNSLYNLTLSNAVLIPNTTATISGSNTITLSAVTLLGAGTVASTNTGITILTNVTGFGALLTAGSTGNLQLSSNVYTGGTYVTAGTILLGDAGGVSSGTVLLGGGTLVGNAATTITNMVALTGAAAVTFTGSNPLTFSGTTIMLGAVTLAVNNATTFSGLVGQGNTGRALTVNGVGTLTLSNSNNFYDGGTTLNASTNTVPLGTLVAGSSTGLGYALGTGTLTLTTGYFQVGGAFAVPNAVSLNGAAGTILIFSGSNPVVLNGNVTLAGAPTVQALTNTTFNGVLSAAISFTLLGGNVTFTAANTYTGATVISGGSLTLSGNGTLAAGSAVTLNQGGTLVLDNTSTNNNARIPGAFTLNGGTLQIKGNSGNTSESIGAITLGAGNSTVILTPQGGGTLTLAGTTLTRAAGSGGTLNFSASNLGTTTLVTFSTSPGSGVVIPYATVNGSDFATYVAGTSIESYAASGGSYVSLSGAAATANVNLPGTGSTTVTANQTVNSLLVNGNSTLIINPGVTLTVTSGAVFVNGAFTLNVEGGGTLALGEAIINTSSGSSVSINPLTDGTQLSGTNLTLAGAGVVNLPSTNNFAAGATALTGATLNLGTTTAIGSGTITLVSGGLQASPAGGVLITNAVTLSNSNVTLGGSNPLLFSGGIALNGTNDTLTASNTAVTAFDGVISGAGILTKAGPGTLVLANNANTYTSLTFINAGIIQVQGVTTTPMGTAATAAVVANGAAVQILAATATVPKALVLNGNGPDGSGALRILAGSGNVTLSTAITLQSNSSIAADAGTTLTDTGALGGIANLTKLGAGTVVFNAASTIAGNITVSNGIANVQNATGLGLVSGSVTVSSGASLQIQVTVGGKQLTLNGTGFGNTATQSGALGEGALVAVVASASWTGNVTLNSGTTVGAANTFTLTLSGVVSGTDLTKVGLGGVTLLAANTFTGNVSVNAGTLTLSNTNAYTGTTTISGAAINGTFTGGTLVLNLLGTATGSSGFTINQNSTLTLDNTQINNTSRISATAPITLNTGTLNFLAMNVAGVSSSQSVGTITLASGQSTINSGYTAVPAAGATSVLTSAGLNRNPGATVNFVGGASNVAPLGVANNYLNLNTLAGLATGTFTLTYNGRTTAAIPLAATIPATGASESGNTVTIVAPNSFSVGQQITIAGMTPATYNITATVTSASATQFTYTDATAAIAASTVGGTAVLTPLSLAVAIQSALGALTNVGSGINGTNANGDSNFQVTAPNANTIAISLVNQLAGSTLPITLTPTGVTGGSLFMLNPTGVSSQVLFSNLSATPSTTTPLQFVGNQGNILQYAEVNGGANTGDFATYGSTGITAFQNYLVQAIPTATTSTTLNGGAADIVKVTTNNSTGTAVTITASANQTIGALVFANTNLGNNAAATTDNSQINPTGSLSIASGAILTLSSSSSTNSSNTVSLGAGTGGDPFNLSGETILFQNAQGTGNTNFNGPINGTGSLVIAGSNSVFLSTTPNTYSGGTTLNSGTVISGNAANNGAGNFGIGPITLVGGSFNPNGGQQVYSNPVNLNGAVTFAGGQNSVFTGPITLVGNSYLTATNNALFEGVVSGSGSLAVVAGGNSVFLNNANTYTGGTILTGGTLQLGTNLALGAGSLLIGGGTLDATTALAVNNTINLSNVTFTIGNSGQGFNVSFTGQVNLIGSNTIAVSNTGITSFSGLSDGVNGSGGAVIFNTAAGIVQLQGTNTFTGGTTISNGTLIVTGSNALGIGPLSLTGGTVLSNSGAASITNPVLVNGTTVVSGTNAINLTGTVTLLNSSQLTVNDTAGLTISGAITESGGSRALTAAGTGSLTLFNPNLYSGGTILNAGAATGAGTLIVGNNVSGVNAPTTALGTGGITLTAGVLQANAPLTQLGAGPVTLNGTSPATVAFTGSAITLAGAVTASNSPVLLLNTLVTLTGAVSGNVPVVLSNTPLPTVSGSLTAIGNLILTNTDSSTSTITINGGSLTLSGGGNLSAITGVTVNTSGALTLDNTTTNNTTRILAASPVTLNGGAINFLGSSTAASSQTFTGALTLGSGNSTVYVSNGTGQTANLTFGSLVRNAGATVNFTAGVGQTLGGSPKVVFTTAPTAPTLTNGILQGATTTDATTFAGNTTGFNLANYGANGVVAQTTYTALPASGAGAATNYIATASTALTASESVNALLIVGSGITVSGNSGSILTLTTGAVASTGTGNMVSVPTLALGGVEGLFLGNSGSSMTVSSTVSGTAGLTVGGAGTLTLSAVNPSLTGGVTLAGGTLGVGTINSIPAANTLTLIGGTFQAASSYPANTALILANPLTFNNSVVTFAGANPILFNSAAASAITLNGANNLITVSNTGGTNLAGQIVNGATAGNLSKLGAGTLYLTDTAGTASTYTGQTTVIGGALNVQSASGLGTSANVVVASGAALQLQGAANLGGFTMNRPLFLYGSGVSGNGALENVFGTNVFSGLTALNGSATLGVDAGELQQGAVMSGPGMLTKVGGGLLLLTQANTYFGGNVLSNGIVEITASAFALGSAAAVTTVQNGATLFVNNAAGQFGAYMLNLSGTGYAGFNLAGALLFNQATTYDGNIILNPGTTIGVTAGVANLDGIISGAADLVKVGAGTLNLLANSTYTGNTVVNGGTLQLQGSLTQGGGTILNTSGIIVNPGATLTLDNSNATVSASFANRITAFDPVTHKPTTPLTLNAGTFNFIANPGVGSAPLSNGQQIGTITLGPGQSTIQVGYATAPVSGTVSALTSTSLARSPGGTVNILGNAGGTVAVGTGANRLTFSTPPATTGDNGGILPYAMVNSTDFATYNTTINTVTNFTGYVSSIVGAQPGDTVKLSGPQSLTGDTTINALLMINGGVGEAGYTLTIASGAVATVTGASNILGGTLAFGTQPAILTTVAGDTMTINSTITGSGGLTVASPAAAGSIGAGNGILQIGNPNSYTGGTWLAGGVLLIGNNTALGSGTLTLIDGTLQAAAAVTLSNPVALNNSSVTISGSNNLTFSGPITLTDTNMAADIFANTLAVTNTALTTLSGNISGAGSLLLAGAGDGYLNQTGASAVVISGNNSSYSGNTYLTGPSVVAASSNAFGTGTLILTTGSLFAEAGGLTLSNNLVLNGNFTLGGSSYTAMGTGSSSNANFIFSGVALLTQVFLSLTPPSLLNLPLVNLLLTVLNTSTFSGNVSGPGGLTVAGPGNLVLNGSNTYAGGTILNSSAGGLVASFYSGETATADTNALASPTFNGTPTATRIDPSINYPTNGSGLSASAAATGIGGAPGARPRCRPAWPSRPWPCWKTAT